MDDEQIARRVDSDMAFLIRQLAQANPGKSISLTVVNLLWHSSPALTCQWRIEVGHSPAVGGETYAEAIAEESNQRKPDAKLARAAVLRKEADQLEAAAKLMLETKA